MYLTAGVKVYDEMRSFAVERIRTLAVQDDRFELRPLRAEPPNCLECFRDGRSRSRLNWTLTLRTTSRRDTAHTRKGGAIVMRLAVCNDRPLRNVDSRLRRRRARRHTGIADARHLRGVRGPAASATRCLIEVGQGRDFRYTFAI